MTYQEFRKTYRGGLNKWPDMSALYSETLDADGGPVIGSMTLERYTRTEDGGRWTRTETEERADVTAQHYLNAFDPAWAVWARSERNYTRYTRFGRLPYKNVSISPDGLNKAVRVMTFNA